MLRASKLYSNGAVRSNLLTNTQRVGSIVLKVSLMTPRLINEGDQKKN